MQSKSDPTWRAYGSEFSSNAQEDGLDYLVRRGRRQPITGHGQRIALSRLYLLRIFALQRAFRKTCYGLRKSLAIKKFGSYSPSACSRLATAFDRILALTGQLLSGDR